MSFARLVAPQRAERTGNSDSAAIIRAAKRYERQAADRLAATIRKITPRTRAFEYLHKAAMKHGKANRDAVLAEVERFDPKAADSLRKFIASSRRSSRTQNRKRYAGLSEEEKREHNEMANERRRRRRRAEAEAKLGTVITCRGCEAQWCQIPRPGNKTRLVCSKRCENKIQNAKRKGTTSCAGAV